jgi:hypothetical protein
VSSDDKLPVATRRFSLSLLITLGVRATQTEMNNPLKDVIVVVGSFAIVITLLLVCA